MRVCLFLKPDSVLRLPLTGQIPTSAPPSLPPSAFPDIRQRTPAPEEYMMMFTPHGKLDFIPDKRELCDHRT